MSYQVLKQKYVYFINGKIIKIIFFQAMGFMGSGFNAINIGDEIIEINNQVVVCYLKGILDE
jgi:hypothetical protein